MKSLILICLLVFLTVMCNAQENTKPKYSELNQDQLNLALKQARNTTTTGKILTFVGLGVATIGIVTVINEGAKWAMDENPNENKASTGAYVMIFGGIATWIGIPVWIVGAKKKNKIEVELVKFNSPGAASINGIGLKVRF
jgi:hypothetical protein